MKVSIIAGMSLFLLLVVRTEIMSADQPVPPPAPSEAPGAPPPRASYYAPSATPSTSVQSTTVKQLVSRHKDLSATLIAALKDSDGEVRQMAAATLVHIGSDAVAPLLKALEDQDSVLRANAAYVFGQLGSKAQEAVPALLKAMKDDDPAVRRRATYAINRIVASSADANISDVSVLPPSTAYPVYPPPATYARPAGYTSPSSPGVRDPGLLLPAPSMPQLPVGPAQGCCVN